MGDLLLHLVDVAGHVLDVRDPVVFVVLELVVVEEALVAVLGVAVYATRRGRAVLAVVAAHLCVCAGADPGQQLVYLHEVVDNERGGEAVHSCVGQRCHLATDWTADLAVGLALYVLNALEAEGV